MTLEEYNQLFEKLLYTKITTSNLEEFKKFTKFSPEKFSRRLGLDELEFIKKCNSDKKRIHNKILGWQKIQKLKKCNPVGRNEKVNYFNRLDKEWVEYTLNLRVCVCKKYVVLDANTINDTKYGFYEDIKYLYCFNPINTASIKAKIKVLNHDESLEFYISINDFNENFIDWREHLINSIID